MSEQEAINVMDKYTNKALSKVVIEAHVMAISALEKQIPKKPYIQQVVKDFREHDCYECPNCDSFVGYVSDCKDEHYQIGYCSNCGQKLDWSDKE